MVASGNAALPLISIIMLGITYGLQVSRASDVVLTFVYSHHSHCTFSGIDLHHQARIYVGRMDGGLPSLVSTSCAASRCVLTSVADIRCTVSSCLFTRSGAFAMSPGKIPALSLVMAVTRRSSWMRMSGSTSQ